MIKKTRLLAGLALGCVLSTPALAQEYRGFYFSVWGGQGSPDVPNDDGFDEYFDGAWAQSVFDDVADQINSDPEAEGIVTLTETTNRDFGTLDDSTDVWGALFGYRFNKYVGAEFGYVHLGELKYDYLGEVELEIVPFDPALPALEGVIDYSMAYRFSSAGPTAAVVGFLPASKYFEFSAKAGVFLADTRQTIRLQNVEIGDNFYHQRIDASQLEVFAGVGAIVNATENFAVRIEYQRFFDLGDSEKTDIESDVDVVSFGVLFK